MENKRKFTSLLINPEFQGKFVAIFTIFGFFQAFVNYYAVYFAFNQIKAAIGASNIPPGSDILDMVSLQEFYVTTFIGVAFVISFLVFVLVGIRFTHQAAGALYRFKKEFGTMKEEKNLHHITLRKDDFFRDVELAFNDMVDEMDRKK